MESHGHILNKKNHLHDVMTIIFHPIHLLIHVGACRQEFHHTLLPHWKGTLTFTRQHM